MATILEINGSTVKVGTDDDKVVEVPIAALNYSAPQVGDTVKLYKDGSSYIVTKEAGSMGSLMDTDGNGVKTINKHLFVWVFSFLLGGFGIDRFMRGQVGIGVCKLLFSWITFGIWELVDWIIALTKAYGSGNNSENLRFDKDGNYL